MTKHSTLFERDARVRHITLQWLGTVMQKPWDENQSVKVQVDGALGGEYFRKVDLIVVPDDEKAPVAKPVAPAVVPPPKAPAPKLPAAEPPRPPIQQLIDQAEDKRQKLQLEIRLLEDKIATLKEVRKEMNALS